MTPKDIPEFAAVWKSVASMYNRDPKDFEIQLCFEAFDKYSLPEVKSAISSHVKNPDGGQFMPKPADIVRYIDGDGNSAANKAWALVDRAIRCPGSAVSVVFDDPITMAIIEQKGGWIELGRIPNEEDLKFYGISFCKLYQSYLAKPPERHPSKLIGKDEHELMREFPKLVEPPRLIGDPEKAQEVLLSGTSREPVSTDIKALDSKGEVAKIMAKLRAPSEEI